MRDIVTLGDVFRPEVLAAPVNVDVVASAAHGLILQQAVVAAARSAR